MYATKKNCFPPPVDACSQNQTLNPINFNGNNFITYFQHCIQTLRNENKSCKAHKFVYRIYQHFCLAIVYFT